MNERPTQYASERGILDDLLSSGIIIDTGRVDILGDSGQISLGTSVVISGDRIIIDGGSVEIRGLVEEPELAPDTNIWNNDKYFKCSRAHCSR